MLISTFFILSHVCPPLAKDTNAITKNEAVLQNRELNCHGVNAFLKYLWLYPRTNATLSLYPRGLPLQWILVNTETHG